MLALKFNPTCGEMYAAQKFTLQFIAVNIGIPCISGKMHFALACYFIIPTPKKLLTLLVDNSLDWRPALSVKTNMVIRGSAMMWLPIRETKATAQQGYYGLKGGCLSGVSLPLLVSFRPARLIEKRRWLSMVTRGWWEASVNAVIG